jgi:LPS O-antigen subunit length determinant protein (WzzB/FepE family)
MPDQLERIEHPLREVTGTLQAVARSQAVTQDATKALATSQTRTAETIADLTATVSRYIDAADARMRRLEDNLDGLIRAITAEHGNGKSH